MDFEHASYAVCARAYVAVRCSMRACHDNRSTNPQTFRRLSCPLRNRQLRLLQMLAMAWEATWKLT